MGRVVLAFLFIFLMINPVFPQKAMKELKKEGIEIGLKLPQPLEILEEERKKSFEFTPLKSIPLPAYSYRVSCNSTYCAFSLKDGKVLAYDWKKGTVIFEENFSENPIYTVAMHPFKNVICFGDREGRITIFDLDKKVKIHTIYELGKVISDVKFSADALLLAAAYLNRGEIDIYNTEDYEKLQSIKAHGEGIYYLAFSPDSGLVASGSRDKKVSITPVGGKWPAQILSEHKFLVLSLDFSADNRFLASAGADAKLIVWRKIEDWVEKTPYFTWIHSDWVNTLKLFKDYLITGSRDGRIRIFNYRNKKFLGSFKNPQPIFGIDITPGGEYLFAASEGILIYDFKKLLEKMGDGQ